MDSITIQAKARIHHLTANTIAEATKSYGKVLPFHVQTKLSDVLAELGEDIEADLRAEDVAWKAETVERAHTTSQSWSGDTSVSAGGTCSDD